MMEYCLLCCVFSCCVVLSLLSALEVCEVPGHRGDIPRVVYILRKKAYVGRGRMCSIFMIRVKFEIGEHLHYIHISFLYYFTVTLHLTSFFPDFTVITAVPFSFAVITPLLLTVATEFLDVV